MCNKYGAPYVVTGIFLYGSKMVTSVKCVLNGRVGGGGDCFEINIIQSFHKKEKNMEPILHKALGYGKIIFEAFFLTHSDVSFIQG